MREAYPNELMHYGILGQKWGVRRFQNPDGTLTAAGRRRYGSVENLERGVTKKQAKNSAKTYKKAMNAAIKGDTKKVMKYQKKLSNEDIQSVINRVTLTKKLSDVSDSQVKTGMQKVEEFAKKVGTVADAVSKTATLYDNVAKFANTFGGNLPRIDAKKSGAEELTKAFKLEQDKAKDARQNELDSDLKKHTKDGKVDLEYYKNNATKYNDSDLEYVLKYANRLEGINNKINGTENNSEGKGKGKNKEQSGQGDGKSSGGDNGKTNSSTETNYSRPSQEKRTESKPSVEVPNYSRPFQEKREETKWTKSYDDTKYSRPGESRKTNDEVNWIKYGNDWVNDSTGASFSSSISDSSRSATSSAKKFDESVGLGELFIKDGAWQQTPLWSLLKD